MRRTRRVTRETTTADDNLAPVLYNFARVAYENGNNNSCACAVRTTFGYHRVYVRARVCGPVTGSALLNARIRTRRVRITVTVGRNVVAG
jgi:hypothetical protein